MSNKKRATYVKGANICPQRVQVQAVIKSAVDVLAYCNNLAVDVGAYNTQLILITGERVLILSSQRECGNALGHTAPRRRYLDLFFHFLRLIVRNERKFDEDILGLCNKIPAAWNDMAGVQCPSALA
jgi:hypothetical protein